MATIAASHQTVSTTSDQSSSDDPPRRSPTSHLEPNSSGATHFVPIRPAFRPLLPKPCASGIHTESSSCLTSSISKGKDGSKKGRKTTSSSLHKKDATNNNHNTSTSSSRKRTKTENHVSALPSTIAPSSLMSKRRKSQATTASTSTTRTSQSDAKTKNNASSLHSSHDTSPASPASPPSLASSSTTKSDSEQASIRSPPLHANASDIGVRINKKDVASNLMLSSGISDDLMFNSLSNGWISSNKNGTQKIGSLSIWEETSDHESNISNESGVLAAVSPDIGPISFGQDLSNDDVEPSFVSDSLISYSDSLLESYLTPEPHDSEIDSYAPLDFFMPA